MGSAVYFSSSVFTENLGVEVGRWGSGVSGEETGDGGRDREQPAEKKEVRKGMDVVGGRASGETGKTTVTIEVPCHVE